MRKSKLYSSDGNDLVVKDPERKNNQTVWDVTQERNAGRAKLRNYKNGTLVSVGWGMNADCEQDQIFSIKVGDQEAFLQAEEMMRFLRWV